jgi:hypothetical protein
LWPKVFVFLNFFKKNIYFINERSEEAMSKYAEQKGMKWLALPFAERDAMEDLVLKYDVMHIPSVLVLSPESNHNTIIDCDAKMELEKLGVVAMEQWVQNRNDGMK